MATALHWLDERSSFRRVARRLRPGGWWVAWWNVFGDPTRPSSFHRALDPLFRGVPSGPGSAPRGRLPPQLDRRARERALARDGHFRRISSTVVRWSIVLDPGRVRALYATYSPVATLPARRRQRFLNEVARIAAEEFGRRVTIRMLTPVYTAPRQ